MSKKQETQLEIYEGVLKNIAEYSKETPTALFARETLRKFNPKMKFKTTDEFKRIEGSLMLKGVII